jgi:LmbE family N-acetylglucosaminyl deacetylase
MFASVSLREITRSVLANHERQYARAMSGVIEPMPDDWERGLAIVAHPDDLEYGAASAVAAWTRAGKDVRYVLVTRGEAGIDSLAPEECGPLRTVEQERSAAVVGVDVVEFLDHPDGLVQPSIELRRDLAGAIRRHRPEVIVSINHRDRWGDGGPFNHVDHRVVGLAIIDAVRDAANRWLFTDLDVDRWDGCRLVAFNASPAPTHFVDVTETIDLGVASLREHATYLAALDDGTPGSDPTAFLRGNAVEAGARVGCGAAALFEVVPC